MVAVVADHHGIVPIRGNIGVEATTLFATSLFYLGENISHDLKLLHVEVFVDVFHVYIIPSVSLVVKVYIG